MTRSFFAVTTPGLEEYTAQELGNLGILRPLDAKDQKMPSDAIKGGVAFDGSLADLYRANLHLRTTSRILLRVADFRAIGFSELRKKAGRVAWEQYLTPGQAVNLRVSCHKSRLYHSSAVAERVVGAIGDRLGFPPPVNSVKDEDETQEQAQVILVRLLHDQCTISMDSSGELLHRRGYRQAVAKAPLRETLAAGLLYASRWDMQSALVDPFCGSGTIPIEAALLARNIPAGLNRTFAFMNWQDFDSQLWRTILKEARQAVRTDCPPILASDRDAGAIEMAKANAERAGVLANIEFSCRAVSAIEPKSKGWVVTNPPYGLRVSSSKDLRNLYAQLGNVLRSQCPGWRVAILCSDPALLHQTRLNLDINTSLVNGGISVRLGLGEVPEEKT
ncbi:MAG TPA: class I SAM-dependent RNA methyltransferase [Anaerolineales bacterium]|nr:class I SAM-dependent RNA methyltransferase [Anaerolineales bacterium]